MTDDLRTADRTEATTAEGLADGTDGRDGDPDGLDARVYRVLGEQFLQRPDRDRVEAVGIWASEWRCNARSLPPEIDAALERVEEGSTTDEEALRRAYTHLFRGVSERAPPPPYESLYADGQFYGETAVEIRKGYRWAGVDVDDEHGNEPPDHLGLELQFLGELVAMNDEDLNSDDHDLEDAKWWILDEHLTEWVPAYKARIAREDPHDYYGGLVDLALAVVDAHHGLLARTR